MRVVFMGTPEYAVPSFRQLLTRHEVVAVLTQPDRRAGRGYKMQMSPVKALALEAEVTVLQPETLRVKRSASIHENSDIREIRDYLVKLDADVFVVAAYGLILPKAVLAMPHFGCINVHASLLPKYRGASPIHAAIKDGETITGITIMHMNEGIDTGDIILQKELAIASDERTPSLHDRMATLGGECIIEALARMEAGTATRIPQDNKLSSYAPMIQKSDGLIHWAWSTERIINLTRAFDPWPGPYTVYAGETIKIWRVEKADIAENTPSGTVLAVDSSKGILVRTGDGGAWILEIQAAGGKRMATVDFLRGRNIEVGEHFQGGCK